MKAKPVPEVTSQGSKIVSELDRSWVNDVTHRVFLFWDDNIEEFFMRYARPKFDVPKEIADDFDDYLAFVHEKEIENVRAEASALAKIGYDKGWKRIRVEPYRWDGLMRY